MAYDAFISYSHTADRRLAPSLQHALQRLAKPWYRQRALRVFRDESALSANPHLWSSIQTAMDDSEWFVLLASPAAVASEWVDRELTHWLANKSADRIMVVVTDGTWQWDPESRTLTGSAVPDKLRDAFGDEPRHVDLRWVASETDLDLHHARFRDVVAQLAAPMHGIAKDELDGEDVRQHRRARRLARGAVTALTLLVVISLVFGTVAVLARNEVEHQRVVSDSGRLAALAAYRAPTQLDVALLLAIESHRLYESAETRGALLATLEASPHLARLTHGFGGNAIAVAGFSADGRRIAIGGVDGSLQIWDVRSAKPITPRIVIGNGPVASITFSSDGRTIATATRLDRRRSTARQVATVAVRDSVSLRPRGRSIKYRSEYGSFPLALSPDGSVLATVETGNIQLSRVSTGAKSSPTPVDFVVALAFSPNGRTLAVAAEESSFLVDVSARTKPISLRSTQVRPHEWRPDGVEFSADGSMVAVRTHQADLSDLTVDLGMFTNIDVFAAKTGRPAGPSLRVSASESLGPLALDSNGATLAVGGGDGRVARFDVSNGARIGAPLVGLDGAVLSLRYTPRSGGIVAASAGEVAMWSSSKNGFLTRTPGPSQSIFSSSGNAINIAAQNDLLATASDGGVQLWDPIRGRPAGPRLSVSESGAMAFNADGSLLAVVASNASARAIALWDVRRRSKLGEIDLGHRSGGDGTSILAKTVVFSPDGHTLAATYADASYRATVALFDVARRQRLITLPNVDPVSNAIAFSADGQSIATGGGDGVLHLWDPTTGREQGRPEPRGLSAITDIAFSSDGSQLMSADRSGSLTSWDPSTGRRIGTPSAANTGPLKRLGFDPDGQTLAALGTGGLLSLWDVKSHQQIGPTIVTGSELQGEATPLGIPDISYAANGKVLVISNSGDQSIQFWDMRPQSWEAAACRLAGRNLTRQEWTTFIGHNGSYKRTCPQWPAGT